MSSLLDASLLRLSLQVSDLMDNPHILLLFGEEVSRPLLITDKEQGIYDVR